MQNTLWTRDELVVALSLYWKIPYNKISGSSNTLIQEFAQILQRRPAALAYKLMNFTSLDPDRQQVGNKGKSGASKADRIVWDEYYGHWEQLSLDSASLIAQMKQKSLEEAIEPDSEMAQASGEERLRLVKTRINQIDFRLRVLAAYNESCCITGLNVPELLVASHIVPWSVNASERLNPRNGLCLNAIHDKAFDRGLITITNDFRVKISSILLRKKANEAVQKYFLSVQNQKIALPDRFVPNLDFLAYHQNKIFIP